MRTNTIPLFLLYLSFTCLPVSSSLVQQAGDFTIAAILPVHHSKDTDPGTCSTKLDLQRVVETEAIVFAVLQLNSAKLQKTDKTLGYDIEEMCSTHPKDAIDKVAALLQRHQTPPVAFILDLPPLLSQLVAVYSLSDTAVLTLGDAPGQHNAKNVFHLVAGQPRLPYILVELIQTLEWSVVDVVVENQQNYQLFQDGVKDSKICIGRVLRVEQNTTIDSEPSKEALLVFSESGIDVLEKLPSSFIAGREILLASEMVGNLNVSTVGHLIAVQQERAQLTDFKAHLWKTVQNNASWLAESLKKDQDFINCGGYGDSSCVSAVLDRLTGKLHYAKKPIDAVYAVANALDPTSASKTPTIDGLVKMPEVESPTGSLLQFTEDRYLRQVNYEIYDVSNKVSIGNAKTFPKPGSDVVEVNIGKIDVSIAVDNSSCVTSCPEGVSPVPVAGSLAKCCVACPLRNTSTTPVCEEGQALKDGECVVVRLDYLRWRHPLSIVVMVLVVLLFVALVYLVNVYVRKANLPAISVSPLATVPLLLSFVVTLVLPLLPILKPSKHACNAYVFGFINGLGIPLCVLISRAYNMHRRFRTEDGSLRKKVFRSDPQNMIAVVLILIQLVFSILLLSFLPAHVVHYLTDDPSVEYIECSTYGGEEFLFPFFFVIILTIIFSVLNFGAATREEDTYESHFVAISIFGHYFLSFLMLIVVYGVRGKVKVMLICVVSLLYALNYLLFIFSPKIYVIVFKRDPASFSPFPLLAPTQMIVIGDDDIEITNGGRDSP